jgi:hypothetical protein
MAKIHFLICLFLFSYAGLKAQVEKIDTDRPDQTESVFTVPAKWLQVETGFAREKLSKTTTSWTLPTILTRYGLSKKWELRLITEYNSWSFSYNNKLTDTLGLLPVTAGFKVNLAEEKGIMPGISLLAHTGFNRLSSKNWFAHNGSFLAPGFSFAFQNSLSDKVGIGYNLGMEWEDTRETPTWIYTLSAGFNIGENWYSYIEVFGSAQKNEAAQHNADAGIAYWITNNLKVDISGGVGISKESPKNYVAVGFSFRCNTNRKK